MVYHVALDFQRTLMALTELRIHTREVGGYLPSGHHLNAHTIKAHQGSCSLTITPITLDLQLFEFCT